MMRGRFLGRLPKQIFTAIVICLLSVSVVSAAEVTVLCPEQAGWQGEGKTRAKWSKVEDADLYEVQLYCNGRKVVKETMKTTSWDISEHLVEEGAYYYTVRAAMEKETDKKTDKKNNKNKKTTKKYIYSEYTDSDWNYIFGLGNTDGKWKSYKGGKKYQLADGTFVTDNWCKIRGKWYLFDSEGLRLTDWQKVNGTWYYLDEEGKMQTGRFTEDGKTYHLNDDGSMAIGWVQLTPSSWNYFQADGSMAVSTVIDGYVIDEKGVYTAQ